MLESSIARIQTTSGNTVGGGLLVGERLVLTCTHVVAAALGLPQKVQESPQTPIRLDFPLVAPGHTFEAKVVHWWLRDDVAGLKLKGSLPSEVQPAHLVAADDLWEHHFRAFGFPAGHEDGVWASGVLRGSTAASWIQIEGVKETGYRVEPGFSGGPVWDEQLNGIVGIVIAAERQPETKAAFVVPTQALLTAWPALAQIHLDTQMEQLRAKRDAEDAERRARRERQRVVNLRPLDVTHAFKDRVREARALFEHLADASVRFISVVGRGGMGKTALVSRVLADLEEQTSEVSKTLDVPVSGIIYLSARSTGLGLERIYTDVGRMLGEPAASRLAARWAGSDTSLTAKVEYLLEMLQDGLYVILLDNLEDVLTEGGDIAEDGLKLFVERCLAQPGGARLVVTSREEVHLPPAGLTGVRRVPLREGLPEGEAIALLRDLDPQGDLSLRDASEANLRRAAQLTCGVPRALELLAGILQEDLTLRLPNLLDDTELFGEQVVEQLVAEGYRRLGEPEQRVMEALAVFDRPIEITAIAYLLHPWYPGLNVQAALRRLVRGHFVTVNRASGEFSLHPIDREYAYGQLPDSEKMEAYTRCNLELRAAEFYASIRKPEAKWEIIDDLAPQLCEFEHRVRAGDYDDASRLLELIESNYLFAWGHYSHSAKMRERIRENLVDANLRAVNLRNLGFAQYILGQLEEAIAFYRQALEIACLFDDAQEKGKILTHLGQAYYSTGQSREAITQCEQALIAARATGDRRNEGRCLGLLGRVYYSEGWIERAIQVYENSLVISRDIGDRQEESYQLNRLGDAYEALGQIEQAINLYKEGLAIAQDIGYRRSEGVTFFHIGGIYYALGQIQQAVDFHNKSLSIARQINHRRAEANNLIGLARVHYNLGHTERAIKRYQEALIITRETSYRRGESYCLSGLAKALLVAGDLLTAQRCCTEAYALNMSRTKYFVTLTLGITHMHQRDEAATEVFQDAVACCQSRLSKTAGVYKPRFTLAAAHVGQAVCDSRWIDAVARADLLAPALEEYRRALAITAASGIVGDALRDLGLIRDAGIEGLEPAFELLESTKAS